MKKVLKKVVAGILTLAMTGCMVACSGSEGSSSSTGSGNEVGDTIKIGLVTGVTGSGAVYSEQMVNASELAVEEINKEGGVLGKELELIIGDDKGSSEEAVTVTQKMITQDKINIWMGTLNSSNTVACLSVTNQAGILAMAPIAAADSITETGSGLVFRNCANNTMQVQQLCEYIASERPEKKFAIIAENTEYGKSLVDNFEKDMEELGGEIVCTEYYESGATDFHTQLTNIKSKDVEAITICGLVSEGSQVLVQAQELGIESQFYSFGGFMGQQPIDLAGEAANGIIHTEYFTPIEDGGVIDQFVAAYQEKYNEIPDSYYAAGMYDAVYLIKEAIEKADSTDTKDIAAAMQEINYDGVMGNVTFDETGQANMKVWIGQVQDMKQTVIYRPE